MNSVQFWTALERKAKEIGFSEISACPLTELKEEAEHLENWLQKDYAGEMEYMKKTKEVRKNPQLFLPDARSVLVGAVNYYRARSLSFPPRIKARDKLQRESSSVAKLEPGLTDQLEIPKQVREDNVAGKIARYAAGRDYHKVMKRMFRNLQNFLRNELFPGTTVADYRISLDVHPVMERAWAQKSGLGFLGKNSCLITAKAGSWVLIGAILTSQEIPRKPVRKGELNFSQLSCGNCTRCIDVCPTGAIVRPGEIDARKCIAYLTIENKGGIPVEFREQIGDRLFGCDICQEVCPYNLPRQKQEENPLMEKEITGTEVLISDILKIEDDAGFLRRFAGSPLMRPKRRGMLRNACVVAGNLGNVRFLPLLRRLRKREPDPMIREHASWAIRKILQAAN